MSQLHAESFSWTPLGSSAPTLRDVTFDIERGERVLLAGVSGSGKSTLMRALAGVLDEVAPGDAAGALTVDGAKPVAGSGRIGLVGQHPLDSTVAATIGRDVAFGLENLGLAREEIWRRVGEALEAAGLGFGLDHPTQALSGGQAQRLALAGVLAMRPSVLLLDEPVSMLDAASGAALRTMIEELPRDTTIVVADHDLAGWAGMVDRLMVLGTDGRIVADGRFAELLRDRTDELTDLGLWVPGVRAPVPRPIRLPARDTRPRIGQLVEAANIRVTRVTAPGLRVATPRTRTLVLDGVNACLRAGELTALTGDSGTGKSTLVATMCGLLRPDAGRLRWADADAPPDRWDTRTLASRIGWVPQFSEATIAGTTVLESLCATAGALRHDPETTRADAIRLLDAVGLGGHANASPWHLSGGEQRRLAVVTAVLHDPSLVALDEPTVGLDRHTWAAVAGMLCAARDAGACVLAATHDPNLTALADSSIALTATAAPLPAAPEHHRGLLARASGLSLIASALLFVVGGLFAFDLVGLLVGLVVTLAATPLLIGRRFPLVRLLPAAIGVASVTWSNWFFADPRSLDVAATAGARIAFIAVPGIVALSYLDAARLGDELGQLTPCPPRPAIALVAALQRLGDLHQRWDDLVSARRVRGLVAGRSPIARARLFGTLLFALLVDSVRQAARLTVAMESRGYSAQHLHGVRRTWAERASWTRTDTLTVVLAASIAIVVPAAGLLT